MHVGRNLKLLANSCFRIEAMHQCALANVEIVATRLCVRR
jgi:hypothetical protein